MSTSVITGTAGNDLLLGSSGNDTINALAGDDTIDAGAGNDNPVDPGPGNDWVSAGSGNDYVVLGGPSERGSDTLDGGDGYDVVRYDYNVNGFSDPVVFPGAVSTGRQSDPLGGTDVISNVEELQVNAGSGNDRITGDSKLRNQIWGNEGSDTLIGGSNNDYIKAWRGADSVLGLGGNDYLEVHGLGGDSNDTVDGGEGYDTVSYTWWGSDEKLIFVSLRNPGQNSYVQADPSGGEDLILNIEQVDITGGRKGDQLTGDAGINVLRGQQGSDTLTGGGGSDVFLYNATATDGGLIDLAQPADLITDFGVDDSVRIDNWAAPNSQILLMAGDPSSLLLGQAVVVAGAGGSGEVVLHVGADSIAGSDLSVRLQGSLDPSRFALFTEGNRGIFLYSSGTQGDDATIVGTSGNDRLAGLGGNDSISALEGNDTIDGGTGNDALNGGLGSDRFNLGQDAGDDSIDGGGHNTRTPWPSLLTVPDSGDDYDRLDYRNAAGGITLDLSARTVSVSGLAGLDRYINVEEVLGSANKDTVVGTPSQGFLSNPTTGHSFFFWGLGGSDEITQTPYSDNGRWPAGAGARWTDGLQVGYSWSDTPITVNWVGNEAKVSYGAGTGAKAGTNTAYAAGVDTLRNVMNIATTDFDDVINGQGATLNHLGYLTNSYERISYFIVDARGGNDIVRGNGNFLLIPSVNTAASAAPADNRGLLVDGRSLDTNGMLTMDLSHLKAAFSATASHGVVKFSGVSYVFGTPFNDTVYAGNGIDNFRGQGGDDSFYGDDYNNQASYRSATNAIEVNLAVGTAKDRAAGSSGNPQGGTSNGSDTLRGVEAIEGTRYDDVFDARGFSQTSQNAGGIAAGWMGMRNGFLPMGGNDSVTGNGYTGLSYFNAMMGIKADLAAGYVDALTGDPTLRASPDYLYTVGRTTFSGVAAIEGTDYADSIAGGTNTMLYGTTPMEVFGPRGGADTVDGRSGYDIVYYTTSPNPIKVDMRLGTGQVIDDGWGSTDTLIGVERVEGSHFNDSLVGSNADHTDFRGGRGADTIDGGGGYDELSYSTRRLTDPTGVGGVIVDLGGSAVDAASRNATVTAANVPLSANAARPGSLPAGFTGWARDNWGDIDLLKDMEGVEGSDWDDLLIGSDATNRLDGAQGNDTIDGAGGEDWVEYNGAEAGVVVDLAAGLASNDGAGFTDVLRNIENVQGSIFADRITGDAGPNKLEAEAGNDTLVGGAGIDTLDGGDGYDVVRYDYNVNSFINPIQFTGTVSNGTQIDPLGGTDVIRNVEELQVNGASGNDFIAGDLILRNQIWGNEGSDTLIGGSNNDYIKAWRGADSVLGLGGNDYLEVHGLGGDSNDTVDGGEGYDTVSYTWWGSDEKLIFVSLRNPGQNSYVQVDPSGGEDLILNIEQVDITGGRKGDQLTGDAGINVLRGQQGSDTLTGGGGSDVFLYNATATDGGLIDLAQPADLITDFGVDDLIRIDNWAAPNSQILLMAGDPSSLLLGQAVVVAGAGGSGEVVLHVGADSIAGSDLSVRLQGSLDPSRFALFTEGNRGIFLYSSGTQGDDATIVGTSGNDRLAGLGGNDSISALAGNDTLAGGMGNDTLVGNFGNDRYFGGAASDSIDGGDQRRVPWIVSNPDDYDILDYAGTAGVSVNLGTRTATVTGEAGVDSFRGIEEIQGASGAKDTIIGRLTRSAAEVVEGGSALYLFLRGGSDFVDQQAYGPQQLWADGVYVAYHWSLTPIQLRYDGGTATVSYATSGAQLAGTDTLKNVVVIGDTAHNDTFDLSKATLNQLGYISDQRSGKSWHTLLLGRGGSDVVTGNGLTTLNYGAVTNTGASDGLSGLSIDLKEGSANLGHLSSNGISLGTLSFSGVRAVTGTRFNDSLVGGMAANDAFESFRGDSGDDLIDGGSGYDRAEYRFSTEGVIVNLTAGTVTSQSSGTDTLRSIEAIRGSMFDDRIDARGFTGGASSSSASASNLGSFWWGWNEISPEGGNDTIEGNGATYLIYDAVMVPIRVHLEQGVADARLESDKATQQYLSMGRDVFSGVFGVRGSQYDDELIGGGVGRTTTGIVRSEVFQGGAGNDTIDGGYGWDMATYGSSPAAIQVNLADGTVNDGWGFVDTLRNVEEIAGSYFADSMLGSNRDETFGGSKGADSIDGGGGHDEVAYSDTFQPGGVTVRLAGWVGTDGTLPAEFTGSAMDQFGAIDVFRNIEGVEGSNDKDDITGDAANNRLDGRGGADTLDGGEGFDWAEYNQATRGVHVDLSKGIAVDDGQGLGNASPEDAVEQDVLVSIENVQGGAGNDLIIGNTGPNQLHGEAGNDTLNGDAGDDQIDGGGGDDSLLGGDGADLLFGKSGNDSIDGGPGLDDLLVYSFMESSVAVSFGIALATDSLTGSYTGSQSDGLGGSDTIKGVERITLLGSIYDDSLTGGALSDILQGGKGNDTLDGGADDDTVSYFAAEGGVVIDLQAGRASGADGTDQLTNFEQIFGSFFADSILGSARGETIEGAFGNDTLAGAGGNDFFRFDAAAYSVFVEGSGAWSLADFFATESGASHLRQIDLGAYQSVIIRDFDVGDTIEFNDDVVEVISQAGSLTTGQVLIQANQNASSGSTILVGRNATPGADLSIELPGVAANRLVFDADLRRVIQLSQAGATASNQADFLIGTSAAETIDGLGGNDTISGREGNDSLLGNADNDWLRGEAGNDTLVGGAGIDTLDGGDGYDVVRYDYNVNSFINPIQFTGTVSNGTQIDPLGGTDVIRNVEELQVNGASGNDFIAGDLILRNQIWGNEGSDTLIGGSNNDYIKAWRGADSVLGLGGNDYLEVHGLGGDSNDTVDGGEGYDTVSYTWWGSDEKLIFVSLRNPGQNSYVQADPSGGEDLILNIEQVDITGGRKGDQLTGDAGINVLRGQQGSDTLTGGGGSDVFLYNATATDGGLIDLAQPADLITDFGVDDLIRIDNWAAPNSQILLMAGDPSSLLLGQAVVVAGAGGSGEVVLHVGADSIAGSDLSVRLQGSLDPSRFALFTEGNRGIFLYSSGTQGDDATIVGTSGNDRLAGLGGNDSISALEGNDTIDGGTGNDTLNGGLGADRFYLGQDAGDDTIDGGGHNTRTPWPSLLSVPNNGDDYDRLDYRNAAGGITLDLSARTVSVSGLAGLDRYINVEEVLGSANKDTVVGTPSQGFLSNPTTGHSFFFWGLGGSDEITQTPYSDNGRWPAGAGARWTDGLQVGYSWSDTPITVNWVGNEAKVSYGAGTGAKAGTNTAYAAGVDTLRNVMNIATTDFDDVINGQGATLNHLGYLTNSYERISYFIVDARGGNDIVRGNGNFLLIPSVNTAASAAPADNRGLLVDGRSLDTNGMLTMDLSHLKAAFSATASHGVVKFSGVSYVFGTPFNDTVYAGNGIDNFRGQGGDDSFYGDDYNNQASYRSATNAIEVNLAVGTAKDRAAGSSGNPQGGTSNGSDTLRGVEAIEGTRYDDVFDARGFSQTSQNAGGIAAGWMGMRNGFLPMGGNDSVTGNGYTGLSYFNAMMGIKADLAAGYVDALTGDPTLRASPDYLYTVGRTTFSGVAAIEGTDYADSIAGGTNTMLYGTTPMEVFGPRGGADTVDGRSGYDIVYYTTSPNPIKVDMRLGTGQVIDDGWGSTDTLIGVERVEGSHFNDSLVGSNADHTDFRGGRGADTIDGGGGYDELSYSTRRLTDPTGVGGVIVDLGGSAVDAASRNATVTAANVPLSANAARPGSLPAGFTGWARDNWGDIDLLKDMEGVEGSDWDDLLIGSDATNRLDGAQGNDTIDGAGGEDWVEYNGAEAGVVVDLAAGLASNDGAGFTDVLRNIENVQGSIFADRITGDAGPNKLEAEAGNDTLVGGAGIDTFLFPSGLRLTESTVAVAEIDLIKDFTPDDRLGFDEVLTRVSSAADTLYAGQLRIEASIETDGFTGSFNGATVLVGRDDRQGADLTIQLPGVDARKLVVTADGRGVVINTAEPSPVDRSGRTKYFVTQNTGGSITDFDLNFPGVTLQSEAIQFIGSRAVDAVFVRPGVVLDFSLSGAASDKAYLEGRFADYTTTPAGNTIRLERGAGASLERLTVAAAAGKAASDQLIFADGSINVYDLMQHLQSKSTLPPMGKETSQVPPAIGETGSMPNATIKAFALHPAGDTFSPTKAGVTFIAYGSSAVDKVYVADGTVVEAQLLGPSIDEIYFRGYWSEYRKQVEGNTIVFTRPVAAPTEKVTVAADDYAFNDSLIFADGAVSSLAARSALSISLDAPLELIQAYDITRATPGIGAPALRTQLLDNVGNLDPTSDLIIDLTMPVLPIAGKSIRIVNVGGDGFRGENTVNTLSIDASDTAQIRVEGSRVTINPSVDLDLANKYYIAIDEGAFVAANGLSTAAYDGSTSLNFATVTPGASGADSAALSLKMMASSGMPTALTESFKWLDIEAIGSPSASAGFPVNMDGQGFALVFKDYSSKSANLSTGYIGIDAPQFFVTANNFGSDDIVYIDNQDKVPNDLSMARFVNSGSSQRSTIQFAPRSTELGGYLEVVLADAKPGFSNLADWMQKLGLSVPPMVSG